MSRRRSPLLWSAIALLLILVLGTLVVLVHPVLITGRYYDITIRSVEHGPQGQLTLTYEEALTYDSRVSWTFDSVRGMAMRTDSWNGGGRHFPHWPNEELELRTTIYLTSAEERASGIGDSPAIRERWVLQKGHYRVRPGERLILSRRPRPDGKVFESTIEVTADH